MGVAVESSVTFASGLRAALEHAGAERANGRPAVRGAQAAETPLEQWQLLHSELVLVCPELRRRARELMPEHDPDGFVARAARLPLEPACPDKQSRLEVRRPGAALAYAGRRLVEVAVFGLITIGALVVLVSLADVVVH